MTERKQTVVDCGLLKFTVDGFCDRLDDPVPIGIAISVDEGDIEISQRWISEESAMRLIDALCDALCRARDQRSELSK